MFAINGMPVKMPSCRRFIFDISSSGAAGADHIASSRPIPSKNPTHRLVRNMPEAKKKSPRPRQTLRIAPATHPRQFPRPRGNVGQLSRQVFWLMVHPTPRAFPSCRRYSVTVIRYSQELTLRVTFHDSRLTSLTDSGFHGFRPHLQRRDREGFAPSSLTQESQCGGHSRRTGRRLSSSLMSVGSPLLML